MLIEIIYISVAAIICGFVNAIAITMIQDIIKNIRRMVRMHEQHVILKSIRDIILLIIVLFVDIIIILCIFITIIKIMTI